MRPSYKPITRSQRVLRIVGVVLVIALPAVLMTLKILKTPTVSCEVCMEFRGHAKCRSASGPDQDTCRSTATDNACAFLSSGVTDTLACTQREPVTVTFGK